MNKTKLKTFWEILTQSYKEHSNPHAAFRDATGEAFSAHHEAILSLESRIAELEKKLLKA